MKILFVIFLIVILLFVIAACIFCRIVKSVDLDNEEEIYMNAYMEKTKKNS